jgi:DNA-binding Lrp family transcriptional regulator
MAVDRRSDDHGSHQWSLLTNYAHVLLSVAREPDRRMRDIADEVGITERGAHRIVNELEAAGYLTKHRVGRQNSYEVHPEMPMRHPLEGDHLLGELVDLFVETRPRSGTRRRGPRR